MNKKIKLIRSLFKGREDVFARHWQKKSKAGYMPAYYYDPYRYRLHRIKGGTFKNYTDKSFIPLTDEQIENHLKGEHLIGIYPLLKENSSWFIIADFDKHNWKEECKTFIKFCNDKGIPAHLERSKSGNGGHVWIFFDRPYPAVKSRKILISILEEIEIFSIFDKNSSFDRLFPNQDYLSGKGLGNLIALPFYKPALDQGNSCFVDANLKPYESQWNYLESIKRVEISHLDKLFESLTTSESRQSKSRTNSNKLNIVLNDSIILNRSGVSERLVNFLKNELNIANPEFYIRKNSGKSNWSTNRYFKYIRETETEIIIPRGFVGRLIRYCKKEKIDFEFVDERKLRPKTIFSINLKLRSHQSIAVDAASKKNYGVISAPPGSGKTIIGLKIIAEKQQPALIIVHRKQLFEQWVKSIQTFLGIPLSEIGKIGQGRAKVGKAITVAMIQSLGKQLEKQEMLKLGEQFGIIIIDECHHVPAETFRRIVSKLSTYYQYGLTATPFRKWSDGKHIFIHLGEIIAEIKPQEIENYKRARINIRTTTLEIPFNSKTDQFETLSKVLVHDSERNKLIVSDVLTELNNRKKIVLISERKEHLNILNQFLKQFCETITLSGEDTEKSRKAKWKILNDGNYQVLITTGQFFGEGTDLQDASCLFLVYPFSFKGKLIQYIGRVQRSELTPIIYDYRDHKIEYLEKLFLKRNTYYRHLDRQASLFDDTMNVDVSLKRIITIEEKIKIAIDKLDFRYGAISFKFITKNNVKELEFEIENDKVRPEFDVLKPYFANFLKSKKVDIDIYAEILDGKVLSQIAKSEDLDKINDEVIESMKFKFAKKRYLGKKRFGQTDKNLLDLDHLQKANGKPLFISEKELLTVLLNDGKVKHFQQLRYLASKHNSSILKLRFVLNPFSFVFLLSGKQLYHVILETLDTEEATYIWHIEKTKNILSEKLKAIELDLNFIRNNGRHNFLANQPTNFSRIIHDYTNERKGFVIWKDMLEERML